MVWECSHGLNAGGGLNEMKKLPNTETPEYKKEKNEIRKAKYSLENF